MNLEKRVTQLENLAVNQGRQIEIVANGLAALTVEVRNGFASSRELQMEMKQEQSVIKNELAKLVDLPEQVADILIMIADIQGQQSEMQVELAKLVDLPEQMTDVKVELAKLIDLPDRMAGVETELAKLVNLPGEMTEMRSEMNHLGNRFDNLGRKMDERFDEILTLIKSK